MSETDKLDVARIMVSHANTATLHTGNIINWHFLKKKMMQSSSEELYEALQTAIAEWMKEIDPMTIEDPLSSIDIVNRGLVKNMGKESEYKRNKLKISVKLFLTSWKADTVTYAVDKVCRELGVSSIDALLISFPMHDTSDETETNNNPTFNMPQIHGIWRELEVLVGKGMVTHLGVCDFDAQSLSELHEWAKVKPTIDQINMENCCSAPEDLIEFSKVHDIELLSHTDNIELISQRTFQKLISDALQDYEGIQLTPTYVARYSAIVRCRGIVASKGYVLGAERAQDTENDDAGFF